MGSNADARSPAGMLSSIVARRRYPIDDLSLKGDQLENASGIGVVAVGLANGKEFTFLHRVEFAKARE